MKRCTSCGAPNPDSAGFCTSCGARLPASPNPGGGAYQGRGSQQGYSNPQGYGPQGGYGPRQGGYSPNYGPSYGYMIQPRSIVLAIVLSILTCGIYAIYWIIKLTDEINTLSGNPNATSGGMVILFNIITCGIYSLYWAYKMGQNCSMLNGDTSGGALNLVLAIFGLQIINMALFQDTINRHV